MRRLPALLAAWALVASALAAAAAGPDSHVRVVLDVSGSMKNNDPGKMVVLATLLLHDLAQPNTTLGESFKVLPFDERAKTDAGSWEWKKPGDPIPQSQREWIVARTNRRQELAARLGRQGYDSIRTFFYPGIRRAIDDILQSSRQKDDVRVIVLVTDGVPEPATRDREAELIRRDLVPQLEQHGIRLHILAFSDEAFKNPSFFDDMLTASDGGKLGARYVDATGERLLDNMLLIFGASFGYTRDQARQLPGVRQLDLERSVSPERVAVVVLSKRQKPAPSLRLTPPPTSLVYDPDDPLTASVAGGSYALQWALKPGPGDYGFDTDVTQGSVAVVRPSRLALEVLPVPPHGIDRAMARTPLPLRVLVRSPAGTGGDPGLVKITAQPFGPRDPSGEGDPYLWQEKKVAAVDDTGRLTADGRVYDLVVEFPENQDDAGEVYGGFLEVEARRGDVLVGSLVAEFAHRVEIHPRLSIVPLPASAVTPSALGRGEKYCARFQFEINHGALPHPDRPEYGVRAVLKPNDTAVIHQELREATFLFDDRTLQYEGEPGQVPGEWYKGRTLKPEELLGEHEVCAILGRPTRGDPAKPLALPLTFTLQDAPYDEFGAIGPFELRLLIAPPSPIEKWRAWLIAGLSLLAVLAALWYLRDRPAFPSDLGYAVGRENAQGTLQSLALPDGSPFARLLGLVVERPIRVPGQDRILGRVRPVDEELYLLRPARGVAVERFDGEALLEEARRKKAWKLDVRRTYRLRRDKNPYLFRMEYR